MELIPAIDLLNNIVVKAFSGERKKYCPINSKLTNSSKLEDVIASLLNEYKFKIIYIADLNAIMGYKNNFKIIKKVVKKFPKINFWIDYGVRNFLYFKKFQDKSFKTIIGSETLESLDELKKIYKLEKNFILSLDFKKKFFLGPRKLIKSNQFWPKKTIFMLLDSVGSKKRPNLIELKKINLDFNKDYYLAGGISNNKDLEFFKNNGFKGAILSTAIHERKIIYKNI